MFALLLTAAFADTPCPDYAAAILRAYEAVPSRDTDALVESLDTAEQGFRCGPIAEDRVLRGKFWVAQAVYLDMVGDSRSADRAVHAAWRAWPDLPRRDLTSRLRDSFDRIIARPVDDAAFTLIPLPATGSVVFIDGGAAFVIRPDTTGDLDQEVRTTDGLHIIQLAADAVATTATASKLADLEPYSADSRQAVNVYDTSLFRSRRSTLTLPDRLNDDGPKGGCASGKSR